MYLAAVSASVTIRANAERYGSMHSLMSIALFESADVAHRAFVGG